MDKCSCEFLKRLSEFKSEERLMQFLLGLNNDFENAINNILSMEPLPSMNKAFYLVQQVQKQKEVSDFNHFSNFNEVSALVAQIDQTRDNFRTDWKKDKLDRKCDFCKKISHTKDQDFKFIGDSEWFTDNKKKFNNGGSNSYVSSSTRIAAHVSTDACFEDNPLDYHIAVVGPSNYGSTGVNNGNVHGAGRVSFDMMRFIMQEVLKAIKGKHVIGKSSNKTGYVYAHCAESNLNMGFSK
ncbi:uncharacterized protein LOC125493477 [Beta vulgaris subsp. vulgaris]|uniref:uncharacterized protein LOC125493477 n=1 Tax=Beta vulgaris subsp. vulgaris TaxID=3555 RepID=UPI002036FA05|nr:uncharacterized protein LOC125493477 [Beta vulgaris subsp. vulgaris]